MEHYIKIVEKNSIAEELNLQKGDKILTINGLPIKDVLDYKNFLAEENVLLLIEKADGDLYEFDVRKYAGEDLGITFLDEIMSKIKDCHNSCLFCFIDQLPPGMRRKLYVKDDDYRLSLLCGSYITLTNLKPEELARIVNEKISPLYISIHTTNPTLRVKMLRNQQAGNLMRILSELAEAGIMFHGQIVLCPGINDGDELERSLRDLAIFYPSLVSLSLVPVGITDHRQGLYPLQVYSAEESKKIIKQCNKWQKIFKNNYGKLLVYAADEFYLSAAEKIPTLKEYEGFPQLENGVGLVRLFLDNYKKEKSLLPEKIPVPYSLSIVCGKSMGKVFLPVVKELNKVINLEVNLLPLENLYFGQKVTVSGLLTGSDLIAGLKNRPLGDEIFFSDAMLKDSKCLFLDDFTVAEVQKILDVKMTPVEGIGELIRIINKKG